MMCSNVGQLFQKNFFWWKGQLGSNLTKTMQPYRRICSQKNFFGVLQYDATQQVDNGNIQFSKKIYFGENGQFRPNLIENYATLYVMISSKNFLKCCRMMMGLNRQAKVMLVNFPKKNLFWGKWVIWNHIGQDFCNL